MASGSMWLCVAAAAAALAADMRLAPASSNPFAAHPQPLQEGRRLLAEGRVGDASLAFEAAVQVCNFHNLSPTRDLSPRHIVNLEIGP